MTDADQIWSDRTDDEVLDAARTLSDYTEDGQRVIRAELQRRGLPEPDPPVRGHEDLLSVYVANGLFEAQQVAAFLEAAGIASALRGESTTKTHGFTVDGLGRMEVMVTAEDSERASGLLESAAIGEFELAEDADPESP